MLSEVEMVQREPNFLSYLLKTKNENRLEDYYITTLKWYRDDHSDELPDEVVCNLIGLNEYGGWDKIYKCQRNSIIGMSLKLNGAVENNIISDPKILEKINKFRKYDFKCKHGEFTTQEEINFINEVLNETIEYLEDKYKKK